jgi:tetratricopeptide (TPR) repeat protein
MSVQLNRIILSILLSCLISGCAFWKSRDVALNNPETLYQQGYADYQKARYEKAIEKFQQLKEQYPLHELALRAELGIADAYFSKEEYGYAEIAYNDFVNLHPANVNTFYQPSDYNTRTAFFTYRKKTRCRTFFHRDKHTGRIYVLYNRCGKYCLGKERLAYAAGSCIFKPLNRPRNRPLSYLAPALI